MRLEVVRGRTTTILVVDERNQPVNDSVAILAPPNVRCVDANTPVLASSDMDGKLVLRDPIPREFVIWKQDYMPTIVRDPSSGQRVVLMIGSTLELRITDGHGAPLSGVDAVVSSRPLPLRTANAMALAKSVPVGDPRAAMYRAKSDDLGRVLFRGLSAGPVYYSICKYGYVVVNFPREPVRAPGGPYTFAVAPVHALVASAENDHIIRLESRSSEWSASGSRVAQLLVLHDEVGRKFPDAACRLAIHSTSLATSKSQPPDVVEDTCRVFLERRGWQEVNLHWRPLSVITTPELMNLASIPERGSGTVAMSLVPTNGESHIPIQFATIHVQDCSDAHAPFIPVPTGGLLRLPVGRYRAVSRAPIINALMPPSVEFDIIPNTHIELPIATKSGMAPIAIQVHDELGVAYQTGTISIMRDNKMLAQWGVFDELETKSFLVPTGDISVSVAMDNCLERTVMHSVAHPDGTGRPQRIEVTVQPR